MKIVSTYLIIVSVWMISIGFFISELFVLFACDILQTR